MLNRFIYVFLFFLGGLIQAIGQPIQAEDGTNDSPVSQARYAIVVSDSTNADADWSQVAAALENKWKTQYQVQSFVWKSDLYETLDSLKSFQPRYLCFVARPEEATRAFVIAVHQMTRGLDDDPYTDALWGILTGFRAADALRIVKAPVLTVTRAAAGTSIPLEYFDSGVWYDEAVKGHFVEKKSGQSPKDRTDGPADTTRAIAEAIDSAQLVVSSGHATEKDWQLGYAYRNGFFTSKDGDLLGRTTARETFPVRSNQSKIWLASGNCLIGHISDPDCMALAMIHSANVDSMVGYTVPTWFGYMGWGIQDYYLEQPGRFTLAEAFFANNQALTWNMERLVPGLSNGLNPVWEQNHNTEAGQGGQENQDDQKNSKNAKRSVSSLADSVEKQIKKLTEQDARFLQGLVFDQNVVALYGDPAWQNALAAQKSGWDQKLEAETVSDGDTVWTLTITPLKGDKTFSVINGNGSQRNGRPLFAFLPHKIGAPTLITGSEYNPVITDDFILVPQSSALKSDAPAVIRFRSTNAEK